MLAVAVSGRPISQIALVVSWEHHFLEWGLMIMMTVTRHISRDRGRFAISWFKMRAAGRDESDNMAERLGPEGLGMGDLWLSSHVSIAVR
jgi:hypothetical protein